jgi:hypothetical protein
MKAFSFSLIAATLLLENAVYAEPPKLVSTSPSFWAVNVNPAQKTLSLTFDQPLRTRFFDWFGTDVLSPQSNLETTFSADRKTCSVDVRLAPGRVYICGLNERGIPGVGFQNEKGFALPPTYLVFQTAGPPNAEHAPPVVKSITPTQGAQVDPAKSQAIVITFNMPMTTKKHGLHLFENDAPVDLSKRAFSYSADGTTFTLPYNFKGAAQYRIELNSISNIGFARANRIPLWPMQASFGTASSQ